VAFRSVRERRAADARMHEAFDELIATVKAEDASLAVEEAKKAVTQTRYNANRLVWLRKLLGRASQLGFLGGAEGQGTSEDLSEVDEWDVDWEGANFTAWEEELGSLHAAERARSNTTALSPQAQRDAAKREHYARLLKLPRLVDETLSSWVDLSDDLSDKQIFQELLRMMGLAEAVEPRLMRTLVEAVKQHRLRKEREAAEQTDWSELGPEPLHHRQDLRSPYPAPEPAYSHVNVGGSGNDFAVFVATLLQAIGAHVRISSGCSSNATLPATKPDDPPWVLAASQARAAASPWLGDPAQICHLFTEVRLGKQPSKIVGWVRAALPGSTWLGRHYHYRLDGDGYAWLNLDWIDSHRTQRPGAPYKHCDTLATYHPSSLTWEIEGSALDSAGQPRPEYAPVHTLNMGLR